MPKESPYKIELSPGARKALESVVRKYTSPYRDVMRAKVVLLAAEGKQNKVIAERLGLPRQVVSKWRKRFFEEGRPGLEERPRRGRPRSFPP